jgi:hypothetical protein
MRNTHAEHYESALPLIADIPGEMAFRCEGPFSDSCTATRPRYSITRSALASTVGGMVRSSAAAVLRLRINSNLVASGPQAINSQPFGQPLQALESAVVRELLSVADRHDMSLIHMSLEGSPGI